MIPLSRAARIVRNVLPEVRANGYQSWEIFAYLREFYGITIVSRQAGVDTFEIIDGQKYLYYLMKYPMD